MNQEKYNESILVVDRAVLMEPALWKGIRPICFDIWTDLIKRHKQFRLRGLMEEDASFKQIIPYIIFSHNDSYFLMQRSAKATEQRLANAYSLGIGGHVNEADMDADSIVAWAKREFHEEVLYEGEYTVKTIGLINDDLIPVGLHHVGFGIVFQGSSDQISIKSELHSGRLVPLEECMHFYQYMESWSQLVLQYLLDQKYGFGPIRCCAKD